jgi:Omp85 superfamily domain
MTRMTRVCAVALILTLGLTCARQARAFSLLNPDTWPGYLNPNTWPHTLNPHNWPFTLIPIPEVESDPNSGVTYGLMAAMLFTDHNNQIENILSPDIITNPTLGPGGTFRYLSYPSADEQWYAIAGFEEKIARHVDLDYAIGRTHREAWSFEGRFFFERDPTERFFGIGNSSSEGNETNYTTEQLYFEALLGYNITPHLQIALFERPRYVRIFNGAFESVPPIFKLFPTVKGINGGTEVVNQLQLTHDTRNSVDIPTKGGDEVLYLSVADRRFMSSISYTRFGADVHHYFPIGDKITLATHAYLQYMPAGNEVPFWSMGRLGGESSLLMDQQTLRGYGAGRWVDNNLFDVNIEMRSRVFEMDIFNTHGILELAPFVEAGRVFHTPREDPFSDLHPVGGMGFRGIAEPFVVGYVDVGWGGEGAAVFSGINYPF